MAICGSGVYVECVYSSHPDTYDLIVISEEWEALDAERCKLNKEICDHQKHFTKII